jgi:hypothetical protein
MPSLAALAPLAAAILTAPTLPMLAAPAAASPALAGAAAPALAAPAAAVAAPAAAVAVAAVAAPAAAAPAAAGPGLDAAAAPGFTVTVVGANGSGCPDATSTATATASPDDSSFRVDFSGYLAWAGDGAPATAFRRNCQFTFQITAPDGLTYAVDQASYSGFALLSDDGTGSESTRYYFQGNSSTPTATHSFTGPQAEVWQATNDFPPDAQRFAPCYADRLLNINTELRLRPLPASSPTNVLVLDPSFTVHLTWRPCG